MSIDSSMHTNQWESHAEDNESMDQSVTRPKQYKVLEQVPLSHQMFHGKVIPIENKLPLHSSHTVRDDHQSYTA